MHLQPFYYYNTAAVTCYPDAIRERKRFERKGKRIGMLMMAGSRCAHRCNAVGSFTHDAVVWDGDFHPAVCVPFYGVH